jgi:hypothetical protein
MNLKRRLTSPEAAPLTRNESALEFLFVYVQQGAPEGFSEQSVVHL